MTLYGFRSRTHRRDCWFKITCRNPYLHWRLKKTFYLRRHYVLINMVTLVLHTFVDLFSTLSCLPYFRPYYIRVANMTQTEGRVPEVRKKNSLKVWGIILVTNVIYCWSFILPTSFRLWRLNLYCLRDARRGDTVSELFFDTLLVHLGNCDCYTYSHYMFLWFLVIWSIIHGP
jgi:hypothetical protein